MDIRAHAKRVMRERSRHHVYVGNGKLRRGKRYEFQGVHPEHGVILSGWFIADSSNPVCRGL